MANGKCKLVYLDIGNSPCMSDDGVISFCENINKAFTGIISLETLILRGNSALKLTAG